MEPSQSSQPSQSQGTQETQETQDSSADEELPDLPPQLPPLPPLPALPTGRQTPASTGRQTPPVPTPAVPRRNSKRSREDDSTLMQSILEQTQTTSQLQRIMCEAFTQQLGLHADERLQWGNLIGTMCHRMDWDTFVAYRLEAVKLAQEFM